MTNQQKAAFVKKMGSRKKFAVGGLVKPKHYDNGGVTLNGPTATAVSPSTGLDVPIIDSSFNAAPANLQPGTNAAQLNQAYTGAQNALTQQGQLLTQLQGQNGINNQNQVFQQEEGIANGTGPNLALNQLNATTAQNIAATRAAQAGQRGAAANAGLLARQIGRQGAATQQQAVGQAAALQAGQQQAAIGAAGQIAGTQVGNQIGATTGENTAAQNEENLLQGANTALNNATVANQNNLNSTNATIAQGNQQATNGALNGVLNGASSISSMLAKGGLIGTNGKKILGFTIHSGGVIPHYDDGGTVDYSQGYTAPDEPSITATSSMPATDESAPFKQSGGGGGGGGILGLAALLAKGGNVCQGPHQSHVANFMLANGGKVPAMVSPGEIYLSPEKVERVLQGENPLKLGEKFKGKAKVKGDSLKNDTLPKTLEAGGVVLPRHIVNKMSPEKAELFVHRAMARRKAGK